MTIRRQFAARKAAAGLKRDGIQPNLGAIRIPLHVNVRGLSAVTGEKEASVRSDTQDGGHLRYRSLQRFQRIAESGCTWQKHALLHCG